MELKYTDNMQKVTRDLRMAGFSLQEAGALACTKAARYVAAMYRLELQRKTIHLRNRDFTLKSIVVYPARHIHKSTGKLREMGEINAVVGVKKIGGDRDHYLAMLEIGADKKGSPKLDGAVPIPLDSARSGESRDRAVASALRLSKGYQLGGKIDLSRFAGNPRQQFAIMNSMARRGKLWIRGQKNKQIGKHAYYAVDQGDKKWLYQINGKRARIVRDLSESLVNIPKNPMFGESVDMLNSKDMESFFVKAAQELLAKLD
jgi:hypothetical protein